MRTRGIMAVTALAVTLTLATSAPAAGSGGGPGRPKKLSTQALDRARERCDERDVLLRDRASGQAMVLPRGDGAIGLPTGTRFSLECMDGYLVGIPVPSIAEGNTAAAVGLALDQAEAAVRAVAPKAEVVSRFDTLFTGLHVRMSAGAAERLGSEGYAVTENAELRAQLTESIPLIRADQAWGTSKGLKTADGAGVRIAVLDTGVDYTHPDLGNGCFMPGVSSPCKVVGGYDVVHRDTDPLDDHGHGTHVAAIAAGTGTHKGVAPGASIYAYKVADRYGSASQANVLEGLSRAVDPNRDGHFDDRAHVVNISLGGYGHPDDPIATAVDDAVAAGSTVVVAAGNESWRPDDYANVTTPGVARRAVTVGASAKEDHMALFSSRGPVAWSGKAIVKPDLAAPGVSICAAQHANAYASKPCGDRMIALSGTSMASPHVAGVAALVLQARPELTPDEVKATLTGSSVPLGTDTSAVRRGAGRVDALAAVRHSATPPVATLAPIASAGATRTIAGTVRASGLRRWTLEVAPFRGSLPAEWGWTTLATGTTAPAGGLLKQLAVKTLPDGHHLFRLRVEDGWGRIAVDHGYTKIDKIGFTRPLDADVHRAGGTQPVELRVDPSVSASFTVEVSPGGQPETWTTIGNGTQPTFSWNTAGLAAGWYMLRLTATHDGFSEQDRISVRLDPRLRPGWPLRIPVDTAIPCVFSESACSSERGWIDPVAEDLDGDGHAEILFTRFARTPEVRAYAQDGSLRWATPLGTQVSTSTLALEALSMPVVGDANGDGVKEIYAFNAIDERIYVLTTAGAIAASWPVDTPVPPRNPRLSLGDLDGDGRGELVLSLDWGRILVLSTDGGAERAEWSVPGSGQWFYTVDATYQPAIGDLDGDGRAEIVAMDGNPATITAFAGDGRRLWSVPATRGPAYVPPVIGDIDGDGDREVIAVSGGRSNGTGTEVHVLDGQGRMLPGWPRSFTGIPQGGPVLSDLDGDGRRDVVLGFADSTNRLRALRHDGTDVPGWPRTTNGVSFHPAVIGDADGDARSDVAIHENGGAYGEIRVSKADGTPVGGLVLGTEQTMRAPVLLMATAAGKVGVVASSDGDHYNTPNYTKISKRRVSVYLWELGATHRPQTMTWPTFQRDAGRTGSV